MSITCPLCNTANPIDFFSDSRRNYFRCSHCQLVFVPSNQHLSKQLEQAEYDKHENSLDDSGYLKFLARTMDPLCDIISPPATGLDFGCGPAPALANEMRQRGYQVSIYDPFYFPDHSVLNQQYDFITCTEVIEHIAQPDHALKTLTQCLNKGGIIAIMTKRVLDHERFTNWHYKNDPTHIAFYSDATFTYIAEQFNLQLSIISSDVVLLKS